MRLGFRSKIRQSAQTLVFFALAMGLIVLFCGLAIDSGLLYLAKARLARAVDGAALAAVGNFHSPQAQVATIMRNFAVINFTDLQPISDTAVVTAGPSGSNTVTYNFNDGTTDGPGGNFRRYVEAVLKIGPGGDVTSVVCNARCPVHTYFIGFSTGLFNSAGAFRDLKVTSSAVATRNPRLIMIVVDRSGSMLFQVNPSQPGITGAYGLPQAVMTFLNFFDTSADHIGIVSFSSNARLEVPLTTNFLNAAEDNLYGSFQTNADGGANSGDGIAGVDPEQTNVATAAAYPTTGVRRLKFGGATAADEGIRMGMEQLMADPGFRNPDVFKYLVLFTDGAWNSVRTLVAAPGYTNTVAITTASSLSPPLVTYVSNSLPVPSLMPYQDLTNSLNDVNFNSADHSHDFWQSISAQDASDGYEPVGGSGSQILGGSTNTYVTNGETSYDATLGTFIATNLNVWLQPGAVDYVYHNGSVVTNYVSDYTNPTNTVVVSLGYGDSNVLVVPGYIADGLINDAFDLPYPDPVAYPRYRNDNYLDQYMWPDTNTVPAAAATPLAAVDPSNDSGGLQGAGTSLERQLMFRNYANLLTGYYLSRPDDPLGTATNPLTGALQPLNGNGPYYPSAAFYWPFDLVGVNPSDNYSLINPAQTTGDDGGHQRHSEYSINMLSPAAAPEWAGELFYKGTGAALSGATEASSLMGSASDWQIGAPGFFSSFPNSVMITDAVHNTNLAVAVWRPGTFSGTLLAGGLGSVSPGGSTTGGYVTDGAGGHVYKDAMAYAGRPTHYYDFSNSTWKPIPTNHTTGTLTLQLGNWKAQEYAWHARNSGITIFTVGYGSVVSTDEQLLLAQIANATNTTAGPSNISYNANQPIGQQFYAQTPDEISNDFYQVGTAINAALTQ